MVGTKAGGKKAAITNKRIHGENFYAEIGRKGGQSGNTDGFASTVVGKDGMTGCERAMLAGAVGGRKSRRNKAKAI